MWPWVGRRATPLAELAAGWWGPALAGKISRGPGQRQCGVVNPQWGARRVRYTQGAPLEAVPYPLPPLSCEVNDQAYLPAQETPPSAGPRLPAADVVTWRSPGLDTPASQGPAAPDAKVGSAGEAR
jgi:hypothetical protein